jgi:signal transduction histidine kinase
VRAGGSPDVARVDAGKGVFDEIRIRAAALDRTLDARVAAERHDRVVDGALAGTFMGLALLVIAGAGFALWRGLYRWVLGPMDRLGGQTRAVNGGERDRAIEPDGPSELISLGTDVESMRAEIVMQLAAAERSAAELLRQGRELERSNADLQQFAYVASHDLSEPLRKVANFCQLLERQYAAQLDDRAREYIGFAVDGAKRMQTLIGDLLALSRVGRSTAGFVPVDLDVALDRALGTLADRIAEAGATVRRESALPTVPGDPALLTSLLENLVGNAVKYRRSDVRAEVLVSADADGEFWTVSVRDNGIGVYPQYAERIFAVFQRLHLRDQYGGTGIGLALCRKIVDFHGGRIWLDELQSGPGATFRFTLPQAGASRP